MVTTPENEWPDPQFCIQDSNDHFTAINNELTGTINPILVNSYTTGSHTVVCYTSSTQELEVNDLVYFNSPADQALIGYFLRVTELTANTSFVVVTEYAAGVPQHSATCNVNVVQRGAFGSQSGNVTSNVQRYGDGRSYPNVWISERPAHTSLLIGCRRVLVVQKVTTGTEVIYWESPVDRLTSLEGTKRAVGFAVCVASGIGASAQAFFATSSSGSSNGGSGTATTAARTWVSGHLTIPNSISYYYAGVQLSGPVGSTFVVGEFTECPDTSALPDGSFSTPRAQFVRFLASVSPWAGVALTTPATGGFLLDMQQTSSGVINGGVSILTGLLEGQSQAVGNILSSASNSAAPTLYNPLLHQVITGSSGNTSYYAFCGGNFNLGTSVQTDGYTYPSMYFYGSQSTLWQYLSWDLHGAVLFVGP